MSMRNWAGSSGVRYHSFHRGLNAHKDQFKGEIIGIDAGAGLMNSADKAVQDYSLDFDLKSSSGATMVAFLKKSIDANEWIVVTGWTPHWMFSRYPLKFLEARKRNLETRSISRLSLRKDSLRKIHMQPLFSRTLS